MGNILQRPQLPHVRIPHWRWTVRPDWLSAQAAMPSDTFRGWILKAFDHRTVRDGRRARFSRPVFASRSIFGDDRTGPVEMMVQADADGLLVELGRGVDDDGRNGGRRDARRTPAEIDMEVFELDAPVRRQHRLGAGGPAGTGITNP
jgi:hypothetical protein